MDVQYFWFVVIAIVAVTLWWFRDEVLRRLTSALKWLRSLTKELFEGTLSDSEGSNDPENDEQARWKKNRALYLKVIVLGYGVLIFLSAFVSPLDSGEEAWNLGYMLGIAVVLHIVMSIRSVNEQDLGAIIFFGRPLFPVRNGLVFVPLGVFKLSTDTRLVIQDELPADPEYIWRSVDGSGKDIPITADAIEQGFREPIRIPFTFSEAELEKTEATREQIEDTSASKVVQLEPGDPLNQRVTGEVSVIVRWRIDNYIKVLTGIGGVAKIRRQLADRTVRFLFEALPKKSAAEALREMEGTSDDLEKILKRMVSGLHTEGDEGEQHDDWGITLESASIKEIAFSHGLNEQIQKMAEAAAEGRALAEKSKGERTRLRCEGEGDAAAELARLKARTEGLSGMKDGLGIPAEVVVGSETARAITNNPGQKTLIVGTQGITDLIGVAAAVGEGIASDSKKNGEPSTETEEGGES